MCKSYKTSLWNDSAISLVLVNLDLDRDVLDVSIIYILDCIAERDGWGEASFILTGRYFIDPFDSLALGMVITLVDRGVRL